MPTGQVHLPVCSIPITVTPPYMNKALYNWLSASWNILSCDPSKTLLCPLMGHIRDMLLALLYIRTDRLRDVNWSFWGHTASKWYSWHLKHVCLFVYFKSSIVFFYRYLQEQTDRNSESGLNPATITYVYGAKWPFSNQLQHPSLPSPLGERLIRLKALCSLFATLIPKIPSVMSLDTNTHGSFNCSDLEKNEKCRKLGQNFLIITGQALGFGDRFRTGASSGGHCGRQNTATDNWREYS